MPKTIKWAYRTPRNIRDIRPRRQWQRNNNEKQGNDDDWWYSSDRSEGDEHSHLRGVVAVKRFGKQPLESNRERNSEPCTTEDEERQTRRDGVFAMLKLTYEMIRKTPRHRRRKIVFWGIVLISAWKSIYLTDLDQYSFHDAEFDTVRNSNHVRNRPVTIRSFDDEFSSLKRNVDDMPSSLFRKPSPKIDYGSTLAETGLSNSEKSWSMGDHLLQAEAAGLEQYRQNSFSNSMVESIDHGGIGNNMQSRSLFGSQPSNKIEGETSQIEGAPDQVPWVSVQTQEENQKQLLSSYQEQSTEGQQLHGHSNIENTKFQSGQSLDVDSRIMTRNVYDSSSFQLPAKDQHSMVNFHSTGSDDGITRGNDLSINKGVVSWDNLKSESSQEHEGNHQSMGSFVSIEKSAYDTHGRSGEQDLFMNKDSAFPGSLKMSFSPQGEIGTSRTNQRQVPVASHWYTLGLDCADYGGPFLQSEYDEIIYWRDIPKDKLFASPYYNQQAQEAISFSFWKAKYLTFEMDDAGWNNMRLGLENVMLMAHSMGRTLVLPPKRQIAHGLYDKSGSKVVSFSDFYDIDALNAKQNGLNIITMEQFLEREALNGHLKSKVQGEAVYPPSNQIKWDNQRLDPLWKYIRNVTNTFQWNPKQCVLAFPAAGTDDQHLFSMMADVLVGKDGRSFPHYSEYQGRPVNVDAPPIERFREILAGRRKICMYDRRFHEEYQVVHFKADQVDGTRLITQFYAFLWFEDWRHDLWSKRFIRDNLRYNNEIMCLSARIIGALRTQARQNSAENSKGFYYSVHIRRGDFQQQFPMTKIDAIEILGNLREHIAPGSTLFIATNERDISFFRPIQEVFDVKFLGDFGGMLLDINPNYFPLVEQMVASRGRIFFGTFFSTFSAYIARLRGYYSVKEMQEGYMTGALQNTYFLPAKWKKEMALYQAIHKPLFGRDFPVAWRDIDHLELPTVYTNKLAY